MGASIKSVDDRLREVNELFERSRQVSAIHANSLIERYLDANIYLAIRRRAISPRKYGFLIKAALPLPIDDLGIPEPKKTYPAWPDESPEKPPVFPGQIEIMECNKCIIPSRVWPQVFEDGLIDQGKPLYLFEDFAGWISPISGTLPDGKICALGTTHAVACGQGAHQQIKTAPDAMNDDPRLRIDNWIEGFDVAQTVKLFSRLRIGIYSDGIEFLSFPGNNTFLQDWDLGYGPVDCSFSIKEIVSHA